MKTNMAKGHRRRRRRSRRVAARWPQHRVVNRCTCTRH